jgi:hypothetical protein
MYSQQIIYLFERLETTGRNVGAAGKLQDANDAKSKSNEKSIILGNSNTMIKGQSSAPDSEMAKVLIQEVH